MKNELLPLMFSGLFLLGCQSNPRTSAKTPSYSPPTVVDPHFVGEWQATKNCEKPSSWPDSFIISDEKEGLIGIRRPDSIHSLNTDGEVVSKDSEGLTFRTVRVTESYQGGRQILVGSIWKNVGPTYSKESPRALSVMISIYQLKDNDTLIYEKYGYQTEERPVGINLEPYSKSFPRNYHCVYSRKNLCTGIHPCRGISIQ